MQDCKQGNVAAGKNYSGRFGCGGFHQLIDCCLNFELPVHKGMFVGKIP